MDAGITATPPTWNHNVELYANFDARVGQADYTAYDVVGGVRIGF